MPNKSSEPTKLANVKIPGQNNSNTEDKKLGLIKSNSDRKAKTKSFTLYANDQERLTSIVAEVKKRHRGSGEITASDVIRALIFIGTKQKPENIIKARIESEFE